MAIGQRHPAGPGSETELTVHSAASGATRTFHYQTAIEGVRRFEALLAHDAVRSMVLRHADGRLIAAMVR